MPEERAFFRAADPWGFIVFARNVETPDQVRALTSDLREAVGRDAPVLIDQEGGRVQRMQPPHWRAWPPPLDHMAEVAPAARERAMFLRYRIIAKELRDIGIDTNCAPLADIAGPLTHPFLKNRCYGTDPDSVTRLARAVATGLQAGGVLPVIKHMPGHGRGSVDSHHEVPTTDASPAELLSHDFAPFIALADLPMAMTAHYVYTSYDNVPTTVSARMIKLIRKEICFDGLLMTDDLSMEALGGSVTDRTRGARQAGCDVILHCNGKMDEMAEVASEAGQLSDASDARARRALRLRTVPRAIDIDGAEDELAALSQGTT
ncbi:MAG: glycoside hydrolase family 3 protein [Pseudomonadota bacterium]